MRFFSVYFPLEFQCMDRYRDAEEISLTCKDCSINLCAFFINAFTLKWMTIRSSTVYSLLFVVNFSGLNHHHILIFWRYLVRECLKSNVVFAMVAVDLDLNRNPQSP